MFKVHSGKLLGCRTPNSPSPFSPLASAGKEGPKLPPPVNRPACTEGKEEFYTEPLGCILLSPSRKSPCVTWIHHLEEKPSHLCPREKDTREAGRFSSTLHQGTGSLPGEEAQKEGGGRVVGKGNEQMEESCYGLEADMR